MYSLQRENRKMAGSMSICNEYFMKNMKRITKKELTQKIEKAILNLPESYRVAFEMHRFQNKTYQEIAEELNISSKTVDYRIQQALKQLRKELKDYLPLLLFFFAPK